MSAPQRTCDRDPANANSVRTNDRDPATAKSARLCDRDPATAESARLGECGGHFWAPAFNK
jgi:hypothetical protein